MAGIIPKELSRSRDWQTCFNIGVLLAKESLLTSTLGKPTKHPNAKAVMFSLIVNMIILLVSGICRKMMLELAQERSVRMK